MLNRTERAQQHGTADAGRPWRMLSGKSWFDGGVWATCVTEYRETTPPLRPTTFGSYPLCVRYGGPARRSFSNPPRLRATPLPRSRANWPLPTAAAAAAGLNTREANPG